MAPDWRKDGDEPDYRFSLANERTFLAWVRTGLALVAGAVALDQFGTDRMPRWLLTAAGLALCVAAVDVLASGYVRWRRHQRAMRRGEPLPQARTMERLTVLFVGVAVLCAAMIVAL